MSAIIILLQTLPAGWGVTVHNAMDSDGQMAEDLWLNARSDYAIRHARAIVSMSSITVNPP